MPNDDSDDSDDEVSVTRSARNRCIIITFMGVRMVGRCQWAAGPLLMGLVGMTLGLCAQGSSGGATVAPWGAGAKGFQRRTLQVAWGGGMKDEQRGEASVTLRLRGGKKFAKNEKAGDILDRALGGIGKDKKKAQIPPSAVELSVIDGLWAMGPIEGLAIIRFLHIKSAVEITYGEDGKRAVVIMVPFVEMVQYRKIGEAPPNPPRLVTLCRCPAQPAPPSPTDQLSARP